MSDMESPPTTSQLEDPFAKLAQQAQLPVNINMGGPGLPLPPQPGGANPFTAALGLPGSGPRSLSFGEPTQDTPPSTGDGNPVEAAPEVATEEVPETPAVEAAAPPKRGRGRPRKNPLPEAHPPSPPTKVPSRGVDVRELRNLTLTLTPDRAWVALSDQLNVAELQRADSQAQCDAAQKIAAELSAVQELAAELTHQLAAFGAPEELAQAVVQASEKVREVGELRQRVGDFLVSLSGGVSGTVGAVRITVLDGKAHLDRS